MSSFHDALFPAFWTRRARVEIVDDVSIAKRASGVEERQKSGVAGRRCYHFSGAITSPNIASQLVAFHRATGGALKAFRFRDQTLWKTCADAAAPAVGDCWIGVGDSVRKKFDLRLARSQPEFDLSRRITRPVVGSVKVAIGGTAVVAGQFSVDHSNGIVEFLSAPAAGAVLTAGCRFDIPVRFSQEPLVLEQLAESAFRVGPFSLQEVVAS